MGLWKIFGHKYLCKVEQEKEDDTSAGVSGSGTVEGRIDNNTEEKSSKQKKSIACIWAENYQKYTPLGNVDGFYDSKYAEEDGFSTIGMATIQTVIYVLRGRPNK